MDELDNRTKAIVESLYFEIMTYLEGQFNTEENVNLNKRGSTKLIFKDKSKAIPLIKAGIERVSAEHNIDKRMLKEYLMELIENNIKSDEMYTQQNTELKNMVSLDDEEER